MTNEGGENGEAYAFQVLCVLRLLCTNFQRYNNHKNPDYQNNTEHTVLLRVSESSLHFPIRDFVSTVEKVSRCALTIKEVVVAEEQEEKEEKKEKGKNED